MNYVEHHFGDYARDTAHLSLLEHGAYRLLLDLYYVREKALPADVKDCCRLVRAASSVERKAVQTVLSEFFEVTPDGWAHKRCNAEIARYRDKQEKAKRSATARWNARPSQSDRNANADANAHADASPDAMRTHSEGNAHQTPDTRHQTPDTRHQTREKSRERAARACCSPRCPTSGASSAPLSASTCRLTPCSRASRTTGDPSQGSAACASTGWRPGATGCATSAHRLPALAVLPCRNKPRSRRATVQPPTSGCEPSE